MLGARGPVLKTTRTNDLADDEGAASLARLASTLERNSSTA